MVVVRYFSDQISLSSIKLVLFTSHHVFALTRASLDKELPPILVLLLRVCVRLLIITINIAHAMVATLSAPPVYPSFDCSPHRKLRSFACIRSGTGTVLMDEIFTNGKTQSWNALDTKATLGTLFEQFPWQQFGVRKLDFHTSLNL